MSSSQSLRGSFKAYRNRQGSGTSRVDELKDCGDSLLCGPIDACLNLSGVSDVVTSAFPDHHIGSDTQCYAHYDDGSLCILNRRMDGKCLCGIVVTLSSVSELWNDDDVDEEDLKSPVNSGVDEDSSNDRSPVEDTLESDDDNEIEADEPQSLTCDVEGKNSDGVVENPYVEPSNTVSVLFNSNPVRFIERKDGGWDTHPDDQPEYFRWWQENKDSTVVMDSIWTRTYLWFHSMWSLFAIPFDFLYTVSRASFSFMFRMAELRDTGFYRFCVASVVWFTYCKSKLYGWCVDFHDWIKLHGNPWRIYTVIGVVVAALIAVVVYSTKKHKKDQTINVKNTRTLMSIVAFLASLIGTGALYKYKSYTPWISAFFLDLGSFPVVLP